MPSKSSLEIKQSEKYEDDDWWSWSVWVEGPQHKLDEIDYVEYTLHPTFHNPVRKIASRENKFMLSTSGWGVFDIYARIVMKNESVVTLQHELQLHYPDGTPNTQ